MYTFEFKYKYLERKMYRSAALHVNMYMYIIQQSACKMLQHGVNPVGPSV